LGNVSWWDVIFNRRTRVWRLHNERYKVKSTIATIKHDKKINIWGCFCASGVGNLYRVEGILKKEQYNKILKNEMLSSAKALFRGNLWKKWVFQEVNDPKHTAILNREWIHKNKIRRMDWPAQSPDLNPIERFLTKGAKVESQRTRTNCFMCLRKLGKHCLLAYFSRWCKACIEGAGL